MSRLGNVLARLVLTAIAVAVMSLPALAERRVALVMAANDYRQVRPLDNAVNDAIAIEEALRALDFEVFLETNRDLRRMRRALEDFEEDAEGADVALVFFAGHGVEIEGENRLLPVDADASSPETLKKTSLPLEEVRETIARVGRIGLIVLDACRNDPFGVSSGAGRGAAPLQEKVVEMVAPGLGRMGRSENVLYAFSAAPGETASDGSGENSPFTEALARYLGSDGLEIRSVLTLVQQEVYDRTSGGQLPYIESGLPRLFFASATPTDLPERERLLLAMADVTPDLRAEVEHIAAEAGMPLAPLFGALIASQAGRLDPAERGRKLQEAADAFVRVREEMRTLASSDPQVAGLRDEAERHLSLGAFEEARASLAAAADIDSRSRQTLKENFVERTLSEATTRYLSGGAAHAALRYQLAIDDYEKAAALYTEIQGFDLPDEARYQQVQALERIGVMQTALGDLTAAGTAFRAMEAAAVHRAALDPDNRDHARDVLVARNMIADVLAATGDLRGAVRMIEKGRETLQELMEREFRIEDTRDLAVSYNSSGDVRRDFGDAFGALEDYRSALSFSEILATHFPDDARFALDMAVSRNKIGNALRLTSDFPAALEEFRQALAVAERLAGDAPDNLDAQHALVVNMSAIAETSMTLGRRDEAMAFFERSIETGRGLVDRDPANTQWRRDLGITLGKLADAKVAAGDADGALADHRSALAMAEYLADLDATNVEWQRDLSVAHNKVGDRLVAHGDQPGGLEHYRTSLAIVQRLRQLDENHETWRRDESFTRNRIADILVREADLAGALENYRAALAIVQEISGIEPQNVTWRRDVAFTHNRVGDVLSAQGELDAALGEFRASLEIALALAAADPANELRRNDVHVTRLRIGDVLKRRGDDEGAAAQYRAMVEEGRAAASAQGGAAQARIEEVVGLYLLGTLGVDARRNLSLARAALAELKEQGRLPAGNEGWIGIVDAALTAAAQ